MPGRKRLIGATTPFPETQVISDTGQSRLSEGDWTSLALDLWQSITTAYSVRQPLEENLKQNLALYELETQPKDFPYVNSSNIAVPIIPSKLDALLAQVVAKTLVPEFYMVSGNSKEGQEVAYNIQRYYNAEFRRQRGRTTWFEEHVRWLHLALRDGTAFMEVLWRKSKRLGRYGVRNPVLDDDGLPQFDEHGTPITKLDYEHREIIDYDDVDMKAVWLRDLMIIPDESTDIGGAAAVARCVWPYESDLQEMVEEGLLSAEWVERALDYVPAGTSDVASDRQGNVDKSAGKQIDIGQGQGILGSRFFANRGPLKVWRVHSHQYDMNGDGIAEENVFWVHEQSTFMLGWCPAEYLAPDRPFFGFCPFPRPDRPYGFGVPERLAPIFAEMSKWHNDRNDYADLLLNPPMLINRNEEIHDKAMEWGPGKTWAVTDVESAVRQLAVKDVPIATYQEESLLGQYADQLTGVTTPMAGGQSPGRRSATEVKVTTASSGTRADLISMLFRISARQVINYAHKLKLQYLQSIPQDTALDMAITPEVLAQDVKIDVAGTSDPLDADAYMNTVLGAYNLLQQDPDIAGDPLHRYNLKKQLLQSMRWQNIEAVIGTDDEAKQKEQAELQQRATALHDQQALAQATITEKQAKAHHEDSDVKVDQAKAAHDIAHQQQEDQQAQLSQAVGANAGAPGGPQPAGPPQQ